MPKAIVKSIRRLRFDHKEMTQQELADRIGVTRQTVNAIVLATAFTTARPFSSTAPSSTRR
jgi:plasmid maintenance system antidote protein VapI